MDRKPPYALDPKSANWSSSNGSPTATTAATWPSAPTAYLYHAAGDGTTDSDTNLRGQDMTHLLAKMLRIDVDHPDAGQARTPSRRTIRSSTSRRARPEIWAYGFRNPWRLAFDRQDRPSLGRPERPGPVGAGLPRPQGRELRLERLRRHPPVLPQSQARARRRSRRRPSSTRTRSSARSPAASSIYGDKFPELRRRLHLRRLSAPAASGA